MAMVGDAREAIALAIIPMVLLNAWQIHRSGRLVESWRRFRLVAITTCIGIAAVALLAVNVSTAVVTLMLGVVTVAFALVGLASRVPALPPRFDRSAQIGCGIASGVIGGLAGVWAPPVVIYLSSIRLDKDEFVAASGLLLFLGSVVLAASYATNGLLSGRQAMTGLALVVPALSGFALGERLRARLGGDGFRRAVLVFFLIMGMNLIRRSLID